MNFIKKCILSNKSSLGITLPSDIIELLDIKPGDFLKVDIEKVIKK